MTESFALFESQMYSDPRRCLPMEDNPNFDPDTGWYFRRSEDAKRDDTYAALARCLGDPESSTARGCLRDVFEVWGCVAWQNDSDWTPSFEDHPNTGLPNLVLTHVDGRQMRAAASLLWYGEESIFILPDCWYAVASPFTGFEVYQALWDS